MTFSGPRSKLGAAVQILSGRYGRPLAGGPLRNLKSSYQWGGGLGVWFDPDERNGAKHIVVQVPGQALGEVGEVEVCHILREFLAQGFKATRLDVAVDQHNGSASWLIPKVGLACKSGQLVGARTFDVELTYKGDECSREQVNIGRRGKMGSGRYVRIYDKGLETESEERGQWVRFEVEFSGDVAKQVAMAMADDLDVLRCGLEMALGSFDLRERAETAGERSNAKRRSVVGWWAKFKAGIETTKVVAARAKTSLDSFAKWFSRAVGPSLKTYAKAVGRKPSELFDWLAGDEDHSENAMRSAVFRQICQAFGVDPELGFTNVRPHVLAVRIE